MTDSLPSDLSRPFPGRVRLRTLEVSDLRPVAALMKRHGHPARSRSGLLWALLDNPTRVAVGADAGWVLENGDGIVGFLGNLPTRWLCDGVLTWGASCTVPLVDDDVRAHAIRLLRAFAAQPGAELLSARRAHMPQGTALDRLGFSVHRPAGTAAAWRWPTHKTTRVAAGPSAMPFRLLPHWMRKMAGAEQSELLTQGSSALHVRRLTADELAGVCPGHWPQTWNAWANRFWSRPGLWPERSAYQMSWRLSDPDAAGQFALWAVHDDAGTQWGMALARPHPAWDGTDTQRADLLDWALLPEAPGPCGALLLNAVKAWAQTLGLRWLDATGLGDEATGQLRELNPQARPMDPGEGEILMLERPSSPLSPTADAARSGRQWNRAATPTSDGFFTGLTESTEVTPQWQANRGTRTQPIPPTVSRALEPEHLPASAASTVQATRPTASPPADVPVLELEATATNSADACR